MNDKKFSHGPWCYEHRSGDHPHNRENGWGCEGLWSADGKLIFGNGQGWGDSYSPPDTSDQHLIEAAPELFEALELILDLRGKELGEWLLTPNAKYPTLKDYAEAALKKARGEE